MVGPADSGHEGCFSPAHHRATATLPSERPRRPLPTRRGRCHRSLRFPAGLPQRQQSPLLPVGLFTPRDTFRAGASTSPRPKGRLLRWPLLPSKPMVPGGVTTLVIETDSYCDARPTGPAAPIYHRVSVALGGGVTNATTRHTRGLDVGCGAFVTRFGRLAMSRLLEVLTSALCR